MELEVIESGISILFNEPEINCGDHGENAIVNFPGMEKITLHIPDVDPKNVSLFAHHIWKASILLSKILLESHGNLQGKNVLEFGAGAGIPSIVAARLGANVVASDYPDADIIKKLHINLEANTKSKPRVIGHNWGARDDELFPNGQPFMKFDIILIADTLWMSHQHLNLLADLQVLLEDDGQILGVAGLHSGRDTFDAFFRKAAEFDFEVKCLIPIKIPVGNGFCEHLDWEVVPPDEIISDDVRERNRYLFHFEIRKTPK